MDKYSKNLLISYIPKLLGFLILTFILVWNKLDGQEIQKRPEIIPYRFIPAGDLSCWVDIEIVEPEESAVDVTLKADGTPYSASNIRDNFDDFEKIKADIPEHVSPEAVKQVLDSLS